MSRVVGATGKTLPKMFYVYLIKSLDFDQLYIGSTDDLEERVKDHNAGKSSSTARYRPWGLMYFEAYTVEKVARLREKRLKYHGNAKRELYKRLGIGLKKETPNAV